MLYTYDNQQAIITTDDGQIFNKKVKNKGKYRDGLSVDLMEDMGEMRICPSNPAPQIELYLKQSFLEDQLKKMRETFGITHNRFINLVIRTLKDKDGYHVEFFNTLKLEGGLYYTQSTFYYPTVRQATLGFLGVGLDNKQIVEHFEPLFDIKINQGQIPWLGSYCF